MQLALRPEKRGWIMIQAIRCLPTRLLLLDLSLLIAALELKLTVRTHPVLAVLMGLVSATILIPRIQKFIRDEFPSGIGPLDPRI